MIYRKATITDLDSVVNLSAIAFKKDPLYKIIEIYCKNESTYLDFVKNSQRSFIKSSLASSSTVCLVSQNQGKVVAFAILERPNHKKTNFISYMRHGGWKLFHTTNLFNLLKYIKLLEQVIEPLNKIESPNWYLAHFAVDVDYQGKSIGSKMLKECVLPYLKKHKGYLLTLCTQTLKNSKFYDKNGFSLFDHRILTLNHHHLKTWSFYLKF